MMKRFCAVIACLALLIFSVCAYAAPEVSVKETDSNIIKYHVDSDSSARIISALYSGGKLYSVNEGTGDKIFYAPPDRDCVIKTYALDRATGELGDTNTTENIQTLVSPYLERLTVFLPDASLEEAANYIHARVGGDMAEIVPEMAVNPSVYDTVFIGYTAKNGALTDAVQKMFDKYDFGSATIVPFIYGEVNGTDRYISTLEPQTLVHDALNVKYVSEQDIRDWLEEIGF